MIGTEPLLTTYLLFWLAVTGAAAGSMLDCFAWRRVRGESVLKGRSHCGNCGHVLGIRDLIPVGSYLFHRGRCRFCGAKIPTDCLAAEVAGALLFMGLGLKFDITGELAMWLIFAGLLLEISLIDWQSRIIPDRLLLTAIVNRLVFMILLRQPPGATALSMLVGACSVSVPLLLLVLVMDRVLGKESMGGGDIKLLFVMGLYLDWMHMLLVLFAACVLGILPGLWMRKKQKDGGFPFGPFLALSCILVVLFGSPLLEWYRALIQL